MMQRSFGGVTAEAVELDSPHWIEDVPASFAGASFLPVGMGRSVKREFFSAIFRRPS